MAAVVRVLDVQVIPEVRVFAIVVSVPEMVASKPVAEEGRVNVHEVDRRVAIGASGECVVVRGQDGHRVRPRRRGRHGGRAPFIRRIVDVPDEGVAAAWEAGLDARDHFVEALLKGLYPWASLFECCPVHGPFMRGTLTIRVDYVIAAGCQDDDAEHVRRLLADAGNLRFHVLKRRGAGHSKVLDFEIREDGRQANPLHVRELVFRIADQAVEKTVALGCPQACRDTVAQSENQDLACDPVLLEWFPRDFGASRPFPCKRETQVVPPDEKGGTKKDQANGNEKQ